MAYPSDPINRRDIWAVLIIFAAALLLRLAYFSDYRDTAAYPLLPYSDGYSYFLWAKDIASGDLLGQAAFMKWPLYAYFLGLLFKVSGNNVALVYLLQFALGAVNCVLVYFIAGRVFGRRVAFLAGLACAWYAVFIFYEGLLIYSSLSLFLNSLLFLFILRIRDNPGRKGFFLLGILSGICAITQAGILPFAILAFFLILWQKKGRIRGLIYGALCFISGLFLAIGPVTLRNYLVEKDIVLISGNIGINFYLGNNPQAGGLFHTPLFLAPNQEDMFRDAMVIAQADSGKVLKTSEVSVYWFNKAANFIRHDPRGYLGLFFKKIGYLFSPDEWIHDTEYQLIRDKIRVFKFTFADLRFILPFSLLGILLGIKEFRKLAFLYLILAVLGFGVILFFVSTRYRMGMVPFLVIFASYGIFALWDELRQKNYLRFAYLCIALSAIFALSNYRLFHRNKISYLEENYLNFHFHLSSAMYYNGKSDYQKAMEEIRKASLIEPDSHYGLISYGVIYYNLHDLKAAEGKFREAIKIFPLSVDAYYNLGLLYNQERRFDEAVTALKKALSLDPRDIGAHFELGKAYKGRGKYKEAEAEFKSALKNINRWRTEERAAIGKELESLTR